MWATDKVIQKNQNTAKKSKIGYTITKCSGVATFPGGRLAHPEGQNEEENK